MGGHVGVHVHVSVDTCKDLCRKQRIILCTSSGKIRQALNQEPITQREGTLN